MKQKSDFVIPGHLLALAVQPSGLAVNLVATLVAFYLLTRSWPVAAAACCITAILTLVAEIPVMTFEKAFPAFYSIKEAPFAAFHLFRATIAAPYVVFAILIFSAASAFMHRRNTNVWVLGEILGMPETAQRSGSQAHEG